MSTHKDTPVQGDPTSPKKPARHLPAELARLQRGPNP